MPGATRPGSDGQDGLFAAVATCLDDQGEASARSRQVEGRSCDGTGGIGSTYAHPSASLTDSFACPACCRGVFIHLGTEFRHVRVLVTAGAELLEILIQRDGAGSQSVIAEYIERI